MDAFWLTTILNALESSRYVILFVGSFFEGPLVMLSSGFLLRSGGFDLVPTYAVLVAGDFAADLSWYAVGRVGAEPLVRKFGHYIGVTPGIIIKIEERFRRYQSRIIIISKLSMGFGFAIATLMVAGLLRMKMSKFVSLNLIGGFIWTGVLLAVGYFFGNIYYAVEGPLKVIFVIAAVIFVLVALRYVKRKLKMLEL